MEDDGVSDTEPTEIPEGYQLFEFIDPFEELVGPLCFKGKCSPHPGCRVAI